ncbi:MAG TPA: hypothetical protein VHY19_00345 [Steroidobacteraceae bacterium]|jgi:hypothetical protein|nr:hypothetical protein [Steroidobacteraceae bacterium]
MPIRPLADLSLFGEPLDDPYRRLSLRRFPFGIIYRIEDETLRASCAISGRTGISLTGGSEVHCIQLAQRVALQKPEVGLLAASPFGNWLKGLDVPPDEGGRSMRESLRSRIVAMVRLEVSRYS